MANSSTFPSNIDTFQYKSDILTSDLSNINRYQTLMTKENRTSAENNELAQLIVTLSDKLIDATSWNHLLDAMINIEQFTKSSITDYYQYKGDYNNSNSYKTFNTVKYTNGNIYMAKVDTTGHLPTDTNYWILVSSKGDKGDTGYGVGLSPKGIYNPATQYRVNDLVSYNQILYRCTVDALGVVPTDTSKWELFLTGNGENLNLLETTQKTTLVGAINEVNSIAEDAQTKANNVGDISTLTTSTKTNVVNAVNEVNFGLGSHLVSNTHIPTGIIVMWSGALNAVPVGWNLCDGSNNTPDLRNRFIVGAGSSYTVGNIGGLDSVALTTGQMPSHNHTASTANDTHSHTGTTNTAGGHTHDYYSPNTTVGAATGTGVSTLGAGVVSVANTSSGDHSHTLSIANDTHNHSVTVNSTGSGQSHENRPPYFALAYIMKL